jgi:hypothetical protein
MLHGEVVSLARHAGQVALTVKDAMYGDHVPLTVEEQDAHTGEAVTISLGDRIAWEGNAVWWTSKSLLTVAPGLGCGQAWEVALVRVGYLG